MVENRRKKVFSFMNKKKTITFELILYEIFTIESFMNYKIYLNDDMVKLRANKQKKLP